MKISKEEARAMVWEESDLWEKVRGTDEIIDQRRWVTVHEAIFKHLESKVFYSISWEEGSTECQDMELFEYCEPELYEMEQKEITELKWVPVIRKEL